MVDLGHLREFNTRTMRILIFVGIMIMVAGCATNRKDSATSPIATAARVEPLPKQNGRIVSVNADLRFAVLEFPAGSLPEIGRQMSVFRDGTAVGLVKVSGPHRNLHTIADIKSGDIGTGDQVWSMDQ